MNNDTKTQVEQIEDFAYNFHKTEIGNCKIIREIDRGGMGIVFEAFQKDLQRKVAIKVLPLNFCHSSNTTKRFKKEASILANINHSGVATVFDFGKDENCYYLILEFIEGNTLEKIIESDSLNLNQLIKKVKQTALIIDDLHKQNIIHRDIKPSNIMIKDNGDVILLDFGISKCLNDATLNNLTNQPIGTPAYMPPEFLQSKGLKSTAKSDIYSLGVMLYEIATKTLPFFSEGISFNLVNDIQKSKFTLPRKKNPEISRELEAIILKCMSLNPERRYHNAKDVAYDLEAYINNKSLSISCTSVYLRNLFFKKIIFIKIIFLIILLISILFLFIQTGVNKDSFSINKLEWKQQRFLQDNLVAYKNIESRLLIKKPDNFFKVDTKTDSINWIADTSGFLIINKSIKRDIRISFNSTFPEQDNFYGVYCTVKEGLSGYILKIKKNSIQLCLNHHENIIKEYQVKDRKKINVFVFQKMGSSITVHLNGIEIIRFIDYNPLYEAKYTYAGLFFNYKITSILDLKVYEPKQPLLISPLILGQKFHELNQYKNAIREYKSIIKNYPDDEISNIARFKLGIIYQQTKQTKQAINIFDSFIKQKQNKDIIPLAYYQKGKCYFNIHNFKEAEDIFLSARDKYPDSDINLNIFMFLFNNFINILDKKMKGNEVQYVLDRYVFILHNFPSHSSLLTTTSRKIINQLIVKKKYQKALRFIEISKTYYSKFITTIIWGELKKGEIYQKTNQLALAKETFKYILNTYKDFKVYQAWALLSLGDIYYQEKQYKIAETYYTSIIKDYSAQNEFVIQAKEKLDIIRNKNILKKMVSL